MAGGLLAPLYGEIRHGLVRRSHGPITLLREAGKSLRRRNSGALHPIDAAARLPLQRRATSAAVRLRLFRTTRSRMPGTLTRLRLAPGQVGLQRNGEPVHAPGWLVAARAGQFLWLIRHPPTLASRLTARVVRSARRVNGSYSPTLSSMLCARITATARFAAYSGA